MAYTTPRTWVAGEVVTAALLNTHLRDNVSYLANPPACRVLNSVDITGIVTNTQTRLTFDTELYDTDTMHSTSVNTGRITFNTAGLYAVGSSVTFGVSATGDRTLSLLKAGTTIVAEADIAPNPTGGRGTGVVVATIYKFAAAEWVEVWATQNSGGNLSVLKLGEFTPIFWATWMGFG